MTRPVWVDDERLDLAESGIARWHHVPLVTSTMDVAHTLAQQGAPAGTLVLADAQQTGRGRAGKVWHSAAGQGVWCTLIERDVDVVALGVLSLRVGLALAAVLAPLADMPLWLKWPNDLLLAPRTGEGADWSRARKLAGVLVETRWRQAQVEYVAIGVGINVSSVDPLPPVDGGRDRPAVPGLPPGPLPPGPLPPGALPPGALPPGVSRARVLQRVLPALRAAARARGVLRDEEGDAWASRDAAVGHPCLAPQRGRVLGVARDGALRIGDAAGEHQCRSGSLELDLAPRGDG